MWKKLFIVAVIAAVGVGVFGGAKVVQHIKSEIAEAREWAESQIPVEKQIEHLKKDIKGLDRDIDRVKDELAKEIVECRELTNKTADLRTTLVAERSFSFSAAS
jgi:peptidoglycan hydrolase CwlO-like protein